MQKIIVLLILCFVFCSNVVYGASKNNSYNMGTTYEQAVESDKPMVLLFYTDWCSACKNFLPIFKDEQQKYSDKYVFTSLNAEDASHAKVIRQYNIPYYPTVYVVDLKYAKRMRIDAEICFNPNAFETVLDNYLQARQKFKKKK